MNENVPAGPAGGSASEPGPVELPDTLPATSAPPPPPEVKVRTMKSDLALMAKSGGGLPRFETVRVYGLPTENGNAGSAEKPARKIDPILWILIAVAVLVIVALGYFLFKRG